MGRLIDTFERTVSLFPNKVAVADETTSLTFRQLKDAATEFGQSLADTEGPCVITVDRTCDTIVRIIGAMYGNRTFVPLDPEMPQSKHDAIEARLEGVSPSGPMTIIFTSGSTGIPKGVMKGEDAYCNFIEAFCRTFRLNEQEVIGNQTPFFFDASSKDWLLMMYTGATLQIIPSGLFGMPDRLIHYLNDRNITYTCWVPSAYSIVTQLRTFESVMPQTLRRAYFVGEAFPLNHLHAWMEALPDAEFVNLYGSTELAGVCCYCRLDTSRHYDALPIGQGLDNCEIFLLEHKKVMQEPGEQGEVCVASNTLAEGYLRDIEETSKRFVHMTTPSGSTARVLRTGDLARIGDDGSIVFVGRSDFQIKHMGRRIELQEIEVMAEAIEAIDTCCCVYDTAKRKIVMFCTLAEGHDLNARMIKRQLKQKLTPYMVPNKVYVVDELPRNANGKIDRPALMARL